MLGGFVQFFLNGFKQFVADDGFMGVVDNRPLHFADFDLLMVHNFCAALHQIAGINLRVKDSCHRAGVPVPIAHQIFVGNDALGVFVVAGRKIPSFIQADGYGVQSDALRCPLEHFLHHGSGNRVDYQLVAVIRGFQIPVGGAAPDELPILHRLPLLGLDFPANIQCVGFVNHVPQRDNDAGVGILRGGGIEVFVDGDEADIPQTEILLDVVTGVDGVSPQPGKVFHNDAVHKSRFNVREHLLKSGPVESGSAGAVVDISVVHLNVGIAFQKLGDNHLLGFDGSTVGVAVLHGQADIECRAAGADMLLHNDLCAFFSALSCHD